MLSAWDTDHDGKLDPTGYEVPTGAGSQYLSESNRRIVATADNVYVDVADFLYVKGSIAIDIGSREVVTINTGIPAAFAGIISSIDPNLVNTLNGLLGNLSASLATLQNNIETAFANAVAAVRTAVQNMVGDVVANIKAQIEAVLLDPSAIDSAKGAVGGAVNSALNTATGALSIDSIVDGVINGVVDGIPNNAALQPLKDLIRDLLSPVKTLLNNAFGQLLQQAMGGTIERIAGSVSAAIDAAAGKAGAAIDNAIQGVIDPQIARIELMLDRLVARIDATIAPIFARIQSIVGINIGSGFSTMENVEVEVTSIGIGNATAFVGIPPEGGFDRGTPFADQYTAMGLLIENFNMGLAMFKPVAGELLPTFIASKISADSVVFRIGDGDADTSNDPFTLEANNILVELNLGGSIVPGAAALLGTATIDFQASFPGDSTTPAGYAVATGTTTTPIYIDFGGGLLIRAIVGNATIQISEFVFITGSFAFEMGGVATVQVADSLLPISQLEELAGVIGLDLSFLDNIPVNIPALGADTAEMRFMTIGAANVHAFVGMKGPDWIDANLDGVVDQNEINGDAVGIVINDFDFGMALMAPTNIFDFVRYFALEATAESVSLVGIDDVVLTADKLLVEVNSSTPGVYGIPLFPVVDFASTYQSERKALFDLLDANGNLTIEAGELNDALDGGYAGANVTSVEQLVELLDTQGAPPSGNGADGILSLDEVLQHLSVTYKNATVAGLTNEQRIRALDADNDEKFDPAGYEVTTGGTPVYLDMDSALLRAQGFAELNILDSVILTGSVAFELGETQTVTLEDGVTQKQVTTMTAGGANITAFVGLNGPYWTDADGNQQVSPGELSSSAVGFHITDLDFGIALMVATNPLDLGVYLAAKLNVHSFGFVGMPGLTAEGTFDIALNLGIGVSSNGIDAVDFVASFSEATALFELLDANHSQAIEEAEQTAAFVAGYSGSDIETVAQLVALLDVGGAPPDGYLYITEVLDQLTQSFKDNHTAALQALDADDNGRINTGFEVNTGNPAAPVVLDFEQTQISIRLGGEIQLQNVFRMYGVFLFEVDTSGLKAFVAAGLEIGPDIGSASKIFSMNALGALVINGSGVAADIQISVSIGGALSDVLQLNATARLVFNTTGDDLPITIPAQYVGFLLGNDSIPVSENFDTSLVSGLTLTQQEFAQRFSSNADGSATFTIPGGAPLAGGGNAPNGFYLLATFDGELVIANAFRITADFRLLLTLQRFELEFDGSIGLGGFGGYAVSGGAVIDDNGFAAYGGLFIDIDLAGLVTVEGSAELKINTATGGNPVTVNGHSIDPNTYKIQIAATIGLFGVVSATGDVELGIDNGVFVIAVNQLNIDLFILNLDISGFIRSSGQFSLSGSLSLPAALTTSDGQWGITGGIGVSISNSGFSGFGSVGIVVFGKSFNIASAQLSVTGGQDPSVFIRAEGPLSVYLELTIDSSGVQFDGGLGLLDDVVGAIADVAAAVGSAVVDAVKAVGDAIAELGHAILELGAAIGDAIVGFVNDVVDFIDDIAGAIAEFFSSHRTIVNTFYPSPKYSYSTSLSGGTLTINMNGGTLTGVESRLALAVVNGQLIVDGPNKTERLKVAEKQDQHRHWDWYHWGPWHNVGSPYGAQYANIEYSNMKAFTGVTRIVIYGTNGDDTIVLDEASINIDTFVYGNNGADLIVTGRGNDYVEGGGGNDTIFTNGGQDIVYGDVKNSVQFVGNDVLVGGTGNDVLIGGPGNDVLDESQNRGSNPDILLAEQNILYGDLGNDVILGSPGPDIIIGGDGDDVITGLNNDDTYLFFNGYGADTFADYFGKSVLDFSQVALNDYAGNPILNFGGVTGGQTISVSDTGLTASAGTGNDLAIDGFIAIGQLDAYDDFEISRIRTGTGNDNVTVTALPEYRVDFEDTGGSDTYTFELDQADINQAVARVDISDNGGSGDRIVLGVDSTGFDIYLHPQAVLLNNFNLTFNSGVEYLDITDRAAQTTITTSPTSGLTELRVKSGVTITSLNGGTIELLARGDFTLEAGASIVTTGDVIIRGDNDDVDSQGATIELLGTIYADQVRVYGGDDNDSVTVGNVTSGSETTIWTYGGADTVNIRTIDAETTVYAGAEGDIFNVGTMAPATNGNVDGISASLHLYGESGTNVLNVDDTGDTNPNIGTLIFDRLTGLDMLGAVIYDGIDQLYVRLGSGADVFTIQSTHTARTRVETRGGRDVVNVRTIGGETTIDSGNDGDTINVGSNANGDLANPQDNTGGSLEGIDALLTIDGNAPASGSDVLNLDDTGNLAPVNGTLTATTINGLGLSPAGMSYVEVEHLIISLADNGNTFTIDGTHGAATGGFVEDTTVSTGGGADTVIINDVSDKLVVNGQADNDTFEVNGTGAGSETTLNGDDGNDVINVRAIGGLVTVNTGGGTNTVNVGSTAPGTDGDVNGIVGQLVIRGQSADDTVNVYDKEAGAETGNLTATDITGLDLGTGINYNDGTDKVETLNIYLGTRADTFNIFSTDAATTTTLNTDDGNDIVNVRTIDGRTRVESGEGADTINVGSNAQGHDTDADNNTGGTVNGINALLTIIGGASSTGRDLLTIDDTADTADNTGVLTDSRLTGLGMGNPDQTAVESTLGIDYSDIEDLVISLGGGADIFTVESTHNGATAGTIETTILNTGAGTDTVHVNDASDMLTVNGEDDADTLNVNGTSPSSTVTLNGDAGADVFNIRAMDGAVNVNGGAGGDTTNVGSSADSLPGVPTSPVGNIDSIDGLLSVDGGAGAGMDVLNVDDSNPLNNAKAGTLTGATIRGLELEQGIDYVNLEALNIWLANGSNMLDVDSTHDAATNVHMAQGADVVNIMDASGTLTVDGEDGADTFNVLGTGLGGTVNLNGHAGNDSFNLSDASPVLPAGYPSTLPPPAADTVGNIDDINGLVVINGGLDDDTINVDDSANSTGKSGKLTANSLRGLELEAGVDYSEAEDLNIWLGTGTDGFYIESTHPGTTQLYAGDGNATTNQRDDTVAIRSISGVTTIHGQAGNDGVLVNVKYDGGVPPLVGIDAANDSQFVRTHQNGLGAVLNVHGEGGSDDVTVNLAGAGTALVNVHDNGAENDGVDTLTLNGADNPALGANNDDTFLLRRDFVALLNDSNGDEIFDQVERVNYDENINARLTVNGLAGDDRFFADDNSAITTIDGGAGDDYIQIGQIFGTQRDANANVAPGDEFATTAVIIGIITDPDPSSPTYGQVIFDPTLFSVGQDELDAATVAAIQAAIAYQSALGLPLDGVAYLSDGVSFATTVFGGEGNDVFSVYRNVGTLRLEGEAGDDQFVVRAFVTIDVNAAQQGETEINGGANKDTIQYAINAPVSIDGGDGYDIVVVLGTPFGDNFVVTQEGIFGAGLNVRFDNVEGATLDTLEGDDRIYVLSTKPGVITTVVGGLGSDLIEVAGDVDPQATIYSNDLAGQAGIIEHVLDSANSDFANAGVDGVAVNVKAAAGGDLISFSSTGQPLVVDEKGGYAEYLVTLIDPVQGDIASTPVYLTVSAGTVSTSDREIGGESILISLSPTGEFSKSLVLTFNDLGDLSRTIYVKAVDDDAQEGERVALISHSVNSENAAYEDLPLSDVLVSITDNDKPGVAITEINVDSTFGPVGAPDGVTEVLEGGFTDQYEVVLTAQPNVDETVTVTLLSDAQIGLSTSTLVFDHDNWNTAQTVTITAEPDDGLDGHTLSTIGHAISTTGGVYSSLGGGSVADLDVTVYDRETAGAIVRLTGGSTEVVEGGGSDSYFVRLTQDPGADVTLQISTDGQTVTNPASVVFTAANWDQWVEIVVSADPAFTPTPDPIKVFQTSAQDLNRIQGPLIVEGGVGNSVNQSLQPAVVLPGEQNDASTSTVLPAPEGENLDVLNIFHSDNTDADIGQLLDRAEIGGVAIANAGIALTGFEMAGDQLSGSAGNTQLFGGGITMRDFEVVEILLGKGDETLTVDATLDDAISVVHGGGGSDTITINDRGSNGALVVYGDTSEQRDRYSNDQAGASINGTSFANDGSDIIDASGMQEQNDGFVGVVIYGGPGNDVITGSQDDDQLAGGEGSDTIAGQAGNDHVYGDSHFNVDPILFARDQIARFDTATQLDLINAMFRVVTTGTAVGDTLYGGGDDDILQGDHGVIAQTDGIRRIETTGSVIRVETVVESEGGVDTIHGDGGNDVILGGQAGDIIDAGDGNDIVIGDHGFIDYVTADGDLADIDLIASTSTQTDGGSDTIDSGAGNDIVLGGRFGDIIDAGNGDNLVIGDSGIITAAASGAPQLAGLPITLGRVETLQPDDGGADGITSGLGNDIVLGGQDGDVIDTGGGNDIVLGDNGYIDYVVNDNDASDIDVVATREPNLGGADSIGGGSGNDIIVGGTAGDSIDAGAGNDLVFGDHALLVGDVDGAALPLYSPAQFTFTAIDTQLGDGGGNDVIYGQAGDDIILGQQGNDTIYGGDDDDDIIGGHNVAGGHDADDLVDGINDRLDGGSGNDVIAGDNAVIARRAAGVTDSPRIRVLTGDAIYGETPGVDDGVALVASGEQANPTGAQSRFITLLDHSDTPAANTSGDDYIAGGADDDVIFGQLGDDVIQGDGTIDLTVGAERLADGTLSVLPSDEAATDGDDYIEGNGGDDVIFGNLGQDDIVGGSSDLYAGLMGPETNRPDGSDLIFGGAGSDIARNDYGDGLHTRDADTIAADNANIFRLVGTHGTDNGAFLVFGYDNYGESQHLVPRAVVLLDYTVGGPDFNAANAASDNGIGDEVHGESGDDSIYGQTGSDILFGESGDDDLIGGWGNDWISGGTGKDGVLGDDGRIYTSRNGVAEPLYRIGDLTGLLDLDISTPGNFQQSVINKGDELKKSVNLAPFNLDPAGLQDPLFEPTEANDVVYGGLGDDFLHGGAGDDAISGAEALAAFYSAPENSGDELAYGLIKAGEFAAYSEFDPWHKVLVDTDGVYDPTGGEFLLNFDAFDTGAPTTGETDPFGNAVQTDGNDRIFGDLGNDWLVGGTGTDTMYGGWGDDLLNGDDDHGTHGGANDAPDGPVASYEDIAYGGAGRDVLIGNTGGDRLIDWAGEFNSYIVPFAPFGLATISRAVQPQIFEYLLDLSESDGADATRASDTGNDTARNGEPDGELGMVIQKDDAWQDQTGAPADPQPGNIPGGPRDVLRGADFNNGQAQGFAPDSGTWTIESGRLAVTPEALGGEAVSVFYVDSMLPSYFEIEATINAAKPTAGWKSNAYLIFDYQSATDFKFAGVNISTDKIEMGYRDASGWHVMVDTPAQLKPDRDYALLLAINGTTVTLVVNDSEVFHHVYAPRVDADGWVYGLNYGMVGIGANNAKGRIDNVKVQQLPPETTFEATDDFDGVHELTFVAEDGNWAVDASVYTASPGVGGDLATSFIDLGLANGLAAPSILELETRISTDSISGFIFDRYEGSTYKFAAISALDDQLLIGHYTAKSGWVVDASFAFDVVAGQDYRLQVTLKGLTVSASLWQVDTPVPNMLATVGYVFNGVSVDGDFGLFSKAGDGSFDDVTVKTDDPVFLQSLVAASAPPAANASADALDAQALAGVVDEAIARWVVSGLVDAAGRDVLESVTFSVADLGGLLLGVTAGTTVTLDIDAAGFGWFVDASLADDHEFASDGEGHLAAISGSEADGRMDLLTVVMHELGHVLGFGHYAADTGTVMSDTLEAGVREALPGTDAAVESLTIAAGGDARSAGSPTIAVTPGMADAGSSVGPLIAAPSVAYPQATVGTEHEAGFDSPAPAEIHAATVAPLAAIQEATRASSSSGDAARGVTRLSDPASSGEEAVAARSSTEDASALNGGGATIEHEHASPTSSDAAVSMNSTAAPIFFASDRERSRSRL